MLPDYDEAIAQSLKQQPPPSYQVAMAGTTQLPENNNSVPEATAAAVTPGTIAGTASITSAGTESTNNNRSAIHVV